MNSHRPNQNFSVPSVLLKNDLGHVYTSAFHNNGFFKIWILICQKKLPRILAHPAAELGAPAAPLVLCSASAGASVVLGEEHCHQQDTSPGASASSCHTG